MCKYLIVRPIREEGGNSEIIGGSGDLNQVFDMADKLITETGQALEIFERISVGNPMPSVRWEGRRRPALTNGV